MPQLTPQPPGPLRRVLVVDDDAGLRQLAAEMLAAEGYMVACACDGDDAAARCARERFDLVLTDIEMPGMTGPELLRHLARIHGREGPRGLLMSGLPRGSGANTIAEPEECSCLPKPFTRTALAAAVRRALESDP